MLKQQPQPGDWIRVRNDWCKGTGWSRARVVAIDFPLCTVQPPGHRRTDTIDLTRTVWSHWKARNASRSNA